MVDSLSSANGMIGVFNSSTSANDLIIITDPPSAPTTPDPANPDIVDLTQQS
jgi:hypothetical protein